MIREHDIRWDPTHHHWYCCECERVSRYSLKADAVMEFGEYDCVRPDAASTW